MRRLKIAIIALTLPVWVIPYILWSFAELIYEDHERRMRHRRYYR